MTQVLAHANGNLSIVINGSSFKLRGNDVLNLLRSESRNRDRAARDRQVDQAAGHDREQRGRLAVGRVEQTNIKYVANANTIEFG